MELVCCKVSQNNISVGPSKEEQKMEAEGVFSKLTSTFLSFLNEKIFLHTEMTEVSTLQSMYPTGFLLSCVIEVWKAKAGAYF